MRYKYIITLGVMLSIFSAVLYFGNFLLFGDAHHLITAFGEELAFMPVYIFITAVVAEQLLWRSQKNEISRRTNALVGTFFNEIGHDIIRILTKHDSNFASLRAEIQLDSGWEQSKTKNIHKMAKTYKYGAPKGIEDIVEIGELLNAKKDFMLILMSNASLIEKDDFSELLLSVNHIYEALKTMDDISGMGQELIEHVHSDMERIYRNLIIVWTGYLSVIEKEDQYLYKLAIEQSERIRSGAHMHS
ncbi:MAG: hypothetical protein AB9844_04145 [Clostridiaceae bacterium]